MEEINSADTAWMLVSCALVLLMTPGLALFYGGMVSAKNVLSTCMHSFFAMGLLTLQWAVLGYSLAFAPTIGGFVGGLDHVMLNGVGLEARDTIPHLLFMVFQMMFAIITPALISGAYAERLKFSAYVWFTLLWATLVYDPVCHWVWGPDGWLGARGALDFAGGTVVHGISGVSALVFAIVIGKRKHPAPPHSLPLTLLGAGMLWFGWFGFNAGSALSAGTGAALAFVNTQLAAGAAAFSWAVIEWLKHGRATALGVASGLVAGLVVITPAAGFVSPMGALLMGLLGGGICFGAVMLKNKLGYDDALDAFGIHGVGGGAGAILTGVFALEVWGGSAGLMDGNAGQVVEQVIGVFAASAYAAVVTYVLLKILDATIGLRVNEEEEEEGLDIVMHGERGYGPAGGGRSAEEEAPMVGKTVPAAQS